MVYYEKVHEKEYDYEKFGQPVQLPGDNFKWFKFSDKQVESTGRLIFALQQKYKILGRNVVTHSDVAIEKKLDPGPMFPYQSGRKLRFQRLHPWDCFVIPPASRIVEYLN